jgi:hypothetical protein
MARVALVTLADETLRAYDVDIAPIVSALGETGIGADLVAWDDDVTWGDYDLLLMRSPWDYSERLEEFLAWLDRASAVAPVLNPPEVIRWNLDKAYLLELESAGVAIVPTTLCDDLDEVDAATAALDVDHVVVKPTVSAGSRDTELLERSSPRVAELATRILGLGKTVMVQPAIGSVQTEGEIASLYFDGEFSHAIRKGPLLAPGGGLLGGEYTEVVAPAVADAATRALCDRAVDVLRQRWAEPLLYARLDTVAGPGGPLLLEAELFEPSYFADQAPGAALRYAEAVAGRLGR